MENSTGTQVISELDRSAEVQGYITPIPIPLPNPDAATSLPQTLPQSVLNFTRSLGSITVPHPIPLPGVVDSPMPLLG
jgi:hypothetical protein